MSEAIIAPPVQTEPAPTPKQLTEAQRTAASKWFDESIGKTIEQADASTKAYGELTNTDLGQEPTPPAPSPTEPIADPNPATPEPDPKAEAPKKRVRRAPEPQRPVLDEEAMVRVATTAATKAVQAKPEPKPDPAPAEVPAHLRRLHRDFVALEQMDPTKEGVADRFLKHQLAREEQTRQYAQRWQDNNPDAEYDGNAPEHEAFFQKIEADPFPDGVTEEMLEDAKEFRVKKEAREDALKLVKERESALDERVRDVEHKEAIKNARTEAAKSVVTAVGIGDLDSAPNYQKPVLKDALAWTETFTEAAYKLVNQIAKPDPKNKVHGQVRAVSDLLMQEMNQRAKADPDSVIVDGKPYVDPRVMVNIPPEEQGNYWTIGVQDVIERGAEYIAGQAKKAIEQREVEFEEMAKTRGVDLKKAPAKAPAPAQPGTRTPAPVPQRANAPSLSNGVKTPSPGGGGVAPVTDLRSSLISRI